MLENQEIYSDYSYDNSVNSISDNELINSEMYKKYQKYKLKYLKLLEISGGKGFKLPKIKKKLPKKKNSEKLKKKKKKKSKKNKRDDDSSDSENYDSSSEDDENDEDDEYRNKYTEVAPIYTKNINEPIDKKEILMLPGLLITSLCIISSIISNFR